MEIEFDENDPFEIEVKRFYLPAKLKGTCPVCGEEFERDFSEQYLSNPVANEVEDVTIYHETDGGECEFEVGLRLNINLEIVE